MAMQLGALRTALLEAGATQDKADRAAEEAAGYETRLAGLETRVAVVTWMVGANITLTVLAVGVLITLASRLGELSGQIMHIAR
jgi:glutathione S-transferase